MADSILYARYSGLSSASGPTSNLTIGTLDGELTPSANGATISGSILYMQSASGTAPGLVNTTTQTFAGNKLFSNNLQVGGTATTTALALGNNVTVESTGTGGDVVVGYGATPAFIGYRSQGTEASPSTLSSSGQSLVELIGGGYDGTSWTNGAAKINLTTSQAWTSSAHGSEIRISTTPTGSVTSAEVMRIWGSGSVNIGNTTDQGAAGLSIGATSQFTVDSSGNLVNSGNITSTGVYANTNATAPNVYIDSSGVFHRSTATIGTVTSVSVATANGFAGTVANATTTPAITLTTGITSPVLAGNGTALIAATTTGTGSTVVLNASPTITGTLSASAVTMSGVFSQGSASQLVSDASGNLATSGTLTLSALTLGSIPFVSTGGLIAQNASNLFWDNSGIGLRLGTNSSLSAGTNELLTVALNLVAAPSSTQVASHVNTTATTDSAISQSLRGLTVGISRVITTTGPTDTGSAVPIVVNALSATIPTGQVLTNTSSTGYSGLDILTQPTITGTGTLAFNHYSALVINGGSTNTGTYKNGIYFNTALSGATNQAQICDNQSYSGSFFINSTSTNPSVFSGTITSGQLLPTVSTGSVVDFNSTAAAGVYTRYLNNGSVLGWIGSADQVYGGSASNFDVWGVNSLILSSGGSGTPALTLSSSQAATFASTVSVNGSIIINGSSSGAVTIQTQAAAGTYNFNLPTTAGSSGQVLASGGGGSSAMTWVSAGTNPMTTLGDTIYGGASGAETRLAGSTSSSLVVLTQTGTGSASAAPVWTTTTGTGNVMLSASPTTTGTLTAATISASGVISTSFGGQGIVQSTSQVGSNSWVLTNTSTGTTSFAVIDVGNSVESLQIVCTSTGYSGAYMTNGISGVSGNINQGGSVGLSIGTNGAAAINIDSSQNVSFTKLVSSSSGFASASTTNNTTTTPQNNAAANAFTRWTGSFTLTLNGIAAGTDGQIITMWNDTGNNATITNISGSATGQQIRGISGTGSFTWHQQGTAVFQYDATSGLWLILSVQ